MTSIKYTKKRRGKISDFFFFSLYFSSMFSSMRITRYLISCNPLIKLNYSRVTFQCGRQSKPYLEHHRIGYIYITPKDWLLKSQENASHNTMYLSFLIHLTLYFCSLNHSQRDAILYSMLGKTTISLGCWFGFFCTFMGLNDNNFRSLFQSRCCDNAYHFPKHNDWLFATDSAPGV